MEKKRLYTTLTYAGVLPFVACALMPYLGIRELQGIGTFDYIARTYGLVIVCFLAGVHWGTFLYHRSESPDNLFATSNVTVLAVFFAFLLNAPAIVLFVLILAFLALLLVDYRLLRAQLLTGYYYRLRRNATAIAVVALAATIAAV